MIKKFVAIALITAFSFQMLSGQTRTKSPVLPKQKTAEETTDKRFWPLVAGSGILFITGVVLFAMADQYEDDAASGTFTNEEEDEFIRKAALYWPLAVTSIGTSTGLGIWALKLRFEPETSISQRPGRPSLGLTYSYRF